MRFMPLLKRSNLAACLFAVATAATFPASADLIFSDNFDDGDVSDWDMSTNYFGGVTAIGVSVPFVSAPFSLQASLQPLYEIGTDVFVYANHDFTVLQEGTYLLEFEASTGPCVACVISYDAVMDNALLQRGQSPSGFTPISISLGSLSVGTHSLALGVHATVAGSGFFPAWFDNLAISAVPEPAPVALLGIGLVGLAYFRRNRAANRFPMHLTHNY